MAEVCAPDVAGDAFVVVNDDEGAFVVETSAPGVVLDAGPVVDVEHLTRAQARFVVEGD